MPRSKKMSRKLPSVLTSILARHSPSRRNSFRDLKRTIFVQSNSDQNNGQDERSSNNDRKLNRASYYFPVVGIVGAWAGFTIWKKGRGCVEVACEVSTEPTSRETKSQDHLSLQEAVKQSTRLLKNLMLEQNCPGLVITVTVDGKEAWSDGFGLADVENGIPCTPSTVMRIASISKPLTMTAVGKLWEEKKLDLDLPVKNYVPSWPEKYFDGEKVTITTRHLVSMLGGIRNYDKECNDLESKKLKAKEKKKEKVKKKDKSKEKDDDNEKDKSKDKDKKDKKNKDDDKEKDKSKDKDKKDKKNKDDDNEKDKSKDKDKKDKKNKDDDNEKDTSKDKDKKDKKNKDDDSEKEKSKDKDKKDKKNKDDDKEMNKDKKEKNKHKEDKDKKDKDKDDHKDKDDKKDKKDKKKGKKDDSKMKEFYLKRHYSSVSESLDLFKDDNLCCKPGSEYLYSTHNWTLISAVVEGASQKKFPQVMKELFRDLGLRNTYLDEPMQIIQNRARNYIMNKKSHLANAPYVDNSYKWAGGGLLSTSSDLCHFGNAMLFSFQVQAASGRTSTGFLRPETIGAIWSPVEKTRCAWDSYGFYGMGWGTVPVSECPPFTREQRQYFSHTGGAVGASSVLLILPRCTAVAPASGGSPPHGVPASGSPPHGVVVAIIVNMQSVGMNRLALDVAKMFERIPDV